MPATIVNWAGDDAVSVQEWAAHLGAVIGRTPSFTVTPVPGSQPGVAIDVTRRLALTGPCRVPWRVGMAAMAAARHPGAVAQAEAGRDLRPSTGSGS